MHMVGETDLYLHTRHPFTHALYHRSFIDTHTTQPPPPVTITHQPSQNHQLTKLTNQLLDVLVLGFLGVG